MAARDRRSNLGSNLGLITEITGLDPWETAVHIMKSKLRQELVVTAPECDSWRVTYLEKLLIIKLTAFYSGDEDLHDNVQELISSLVVN